LKGRELDGIATCKGGKVTRFVAGIYNTDGNPVVVLTVAPFSRQYRTPGGGGPFSRANYGYFLAGEVWAAVHLFTCHCSLRPILKC